MSYINSSTVNELNSCLSEKTLINNENPNLIRKLDLYTYNLNRFQTKNVYNKFNSLRLKGKGKYENFSIFEKRQMELHKNKKSLLNLSLKKFASLNRNKNSTSQTTINITENIIKGDYTKLPKLLEKIQLNNTNYNQIINNKNKNDKINNTNNTNNKYCFNKTIEDSSWEKGDKKEKKGVRQLFLTKLKNNIDKEELNKKLLTKTESHLLLKKNVLLNRHMIRNRTIVDYMGKLKEYVINKNNYELKNEQYLQIKENNRNKIEVVNDMVKSMNGAHKFLENKFLIKYNEYFRKLLIEKDNENNKDLLLCKDIYSLRSEIYILEKKIIKLKNEKNIYVRWMLLQIQIKEKMLKTPDNYISIVKNSKNGKNYTVNYLENIIYKDPDEIIRQLKRYEKENIRLIMKYNENKYEIEALKDELNHENKEYLDNYFINEIDNKNKIKQKK